MFIRKIHLHFKMLCTAHIEPWAGAGTGVELSKSISYTYYSYTQMKKLHFFKAYEYGSDAMLCIRGKLIFIIQETNMWNVVSEISLRYKKTVTSF